VDLDDLGNIDDAMREAADRDGGIMTATVGR
jgi:hypothetical protein